MNKDEMIKIQQIEQMAIMDCQRVPRGTKCADCSFARPYSCNSYRMATALVNADYRKVADDEIVIKKSEYEELKTHIEDLQTKLVAVMLCIKNTHEIDISDLLRKQEQETARDILQEFLKEFVVYACVGDYYTDTEIYNKIQELAEKHGIEHVF